MDNYSGFVNLLVKPGEKILQELTPNQAHLLHMAVGASGEAGELLDAVKKFAIYQKPLDLANVVEELGDIEFFLQGIRNALNLDREEILAANVEKLSKRYPNLTYSNQSAISREDKA